MTTNEATTIEKIYDAITMIATGEERFYCSCWDNIRIIESDDHADRLVVEMHDENMEMMREDLQKLLVILEDSVPVAVGARSDLAKTHQQIYHLWQNDPCYCYALQGDASYTVTNDCRMMVWDAIEAVRL